MTVWTIGHSTRPLDAFLALLAQHRIEAVADVRRFPASRRHPQYGGTALTGELARHGIAYHWFASLGGRRRPRRDSPHTAWRNASFRGYADHMDTAEFADAIREVIALASARRTTLLCAEMLWWRCHRALIADALRVRGIEVIHILDERHTIEHPYTSAARIIDGRLSYAAQPAGEQLELLPSPDRERPIRGR